MRSKIYIPQATANGYIECPLYGVFDWNYPESKSRRGRVQDNGLVTPSITCNGNVLYALVPYEKD